MRSGAVAEPNGPADFTHLVRAVEDHGLKRVYVAAVIAYYRLLDQR